MHVGLQNLAFTGTIACWADLHRSRTTSIAPQRARRRLPCNVYDALFCVPSLVDYHRGTPQRGILEHPRFVATAGSSHRRCSVEPCQQSGVAARAAVGRRRSAFSPAARIGQAQRAGQAVTGVFRRRAASPAFPPSAAALHAASAPGPRGTTSLIPARWRGDRGSSQTGTICRIAIEACHDGRKLAPHADDRATRRPSRPASVVTRRTTPRRAA